MCRDKEEEEEETLEEKRDDDDEDGERKDKEEQGPWKTASVTPATTQPPEPGMLH